MNTIINTTAGLALDHARGLVSLALTVTLLVGVHAALHHVVAEQAANAALFDQLNKPVAANVSMAQPASQQQWIPLSQLQ
jgi:hypothetical protein